jgi:hypothetical protein
VEHLMTTLTGLFTRGPISKGGAYTGLDEFEQD